MTAESDKKASVQKFRKIKYDRLKTLIPLKESRKKLVFGEGSDYFVGGEYPFTVERQIANVSDKTSLTFGLNSTKKFVLGDNSSITFLDGVNFDLNLTICASNESDKDKKARVSCTGIAESIDISARPLLEFQLDSVRSNEVNLPQLTKLKLPYGNINTATSQRLLGVEFLTTENTSDSIDLDKCNYANFRLITQGAIDKDELKNIQLINDWSSDDTDFDNYLSGGNLFKKDWKVNLTHDLKMDSGIRQAGGANIVQCLHGLGRIAYEEMTGISKSVTFATDQYSNIYCKGAKFTVICAPHSSEIMYTINSTNNHVRVLNSSVTVCATDFASTMQVAKFTPSLIGFDMSTFFGAKLKTFNGAEIARKAGIDFEKKVLSIIKAEVAVAEEALSINKTGFAVSDKGVHVDDGIVQKTRYALAIRNNSVAVVNGCEVYL